jgi:tetratricopeptide (TPR) repeat protein
MEVTATEVRGSETVGSASVCVLPALEREDARGMHVGAAVARGLQPEAGLEEWSTALEAELRRIPGEGLAARIARAEALARGGAPRQAAAAYRTLKEEYPGAAWMTARVFVLEEQAARPPKPKVVDIAAEGKIHALLIGISKYQSEEVRPLQFAHRDAEKFAEFLRSPRGGGLRDEQITVLTDERATTAAVRTAFATLAAKAGPRDTVMLLVAAHGTVLEIAGRSKGAYLVTHDSDPQDLAATALPMIEIQRLIREELAKAGRVLAFVDACRSGTIGSIPLATQLKVNRALDAWALTEGELFLYTASRPGEVSYEGPQYGGGHGAFTYHVLEALNGAADFNRDGFVDVQELINAVSLKVPEATHDRQHPRDAGTIPNTLRLSQVGAPAQAAARVLEIRRQVDFEDAMRAGRLQPDEPRSAFTALRQMKMARELTAEQYLERENRLRVRLEEDGQQVLRHYLQGEQIPQTRAEFAACARTYEAARLLTPESVFLESRAAFCAGRAALFDRDYEKATELLERAVRLDGDAAYAFNALGISYLEQARFSEAMAALRDAVARAPQWAYPRHNLGLALLETGDAPGALASYEEAMKLAPRQAYLPYNAGLVRQRMNQPREAEALFRKAMELDPRSAEPWNALGALQLEQGKNREAEAAFRKALEIKAGFSPARQNLALVLWKDRGRREEAIAAWRENIEREPGFLPSRLSLAKARAEAGQAKEAEAEYRALLAVRPDYTPARLKLAELLIARAEFDAALTELREAARRDARNPALREQIGDVEQKRGRTETARAEWRTALEETKDAASRRRLEKKLR